LHFIGCLIVMSLCSKNCCVKPLS